MNQYKYNGTANTLFLGVQDSDGNELLAIPGQTYTLASPPNDDFVLIPTTQGA